MYQVGDYVVKASNGVCKVKAIDATVATLNRRLTTSSERLRME